MRVFVYEHITGGAFAHEPLPALLVHEGDLMLQSLVHDLTDIPGVEVLVTRDPRLASLPHPVSTLVPVADESIFDLFRRGCDMADAVWPVAPETGGVLERLTGIASQSGRVLLGCRAAAVKICASKMSTSRLLVEAGVNSIRTYDDFSLLPPDVEELVIKPDDGAGCTETRLVSRDEALEWWANGTHSGFVLQPYLSGDALSLSLLCRNGRCQLLTCNRQRVHIDNGEFRFAGVGVNEVRENLSTYAVLADQVAAAIPGLWGYVGVDIVHTKTGPVVIEVNPRLTTSYAGLRRALHCNPAALVLGLLQPEHAVQLPPGTGTTVEIGVGHA